MVFFKLIGALFVGLIALIITQLPWMFAWAIVGAFVWPYVLNSWLIFLGKAATVVWWQGAIIGFVPFIGHTTIPAGILTFLLMLFLV